MQHLSEEQKTRWLVGQGRDDENEHARTCPTCAADLRAYADSVSAFRDAMKGWSEREGRWMLEDAQDFSAWQPGQRPQLRAHRREWSWVLTAAAAGLLLIPAFWRLDTAQPEAPAPAVKEAPRRDADVLLMEAVFAHLARPVSAPMERVIALLPGQSLAVEMKEREDLR